MKEYIRQHKHIIGCVVFDRNYTQTLDELIIKSVHVDTSMGGIYLKFMNSDIERWLGVPLFLDDNGEIIGNYVDYMRQYYPEEIVLVGLCE